MRHHHIAFCKDHYIQWFLRQTQLTIKKYHLFSPNERVLLAVSGGKDSLALWDALVQLGYQCDGVHINLGIDDGLSYSNKSEDRTRSFAERGNLKLIIHDLEKSFGESLPQIASRNKRRSSKPCSACGIIKRHLMNQTALEGRYDVLLTGHNLDDEISALFSNVLSWDASLLKRQYPLLKEDSGFIKKAKPFCRFYERETTAYALLREILYIEDECPYSTDSKQLHYKALLNHLEEEQPGVKTRFFISFLKGKRDSRLVFNPPALAPTQESLCPNCGQPSGSQGICAFCKIIKRP